MPSTDHPRNNTMSLTSSDPKANSDSTTPDLEAAKGPAQPTPQNSPMQAPKQRMKCKPVEMGYAAMAAGGTPIVCVGVLGFSSQPGADHVRETVLNRLLSIPRFHSKVVRKTFSTYYERVADEDLDLDYHFRVALDDQEAPATKQQVDEHLAKIYEVEMSMDKPRWYMTFFPRVEGGGSVLVAAIDHVIGDGAALVETLLSLADSEDGNAVAVTEVDPKLRHKRRPLPKMSLFSRAWLTVTGTLDGLTRSGEPYLLYLRSVRIRVASFAMPVCSNLPRGAMPLPPPLCWRNAAAKCFFLSCTHTQASCIIRPRTHARPSLIRLTCDPCRN
jgi:hypothetical protein